MNLRNAQNFDCPSHEIAAYIDGEVGVERGLELEAHFTVCQACAEELTHQKRFLCGLNASLKHEGELELPPNFTKLIVANAESAVSGLRRERERYNAVFICVGLLLFVLFALGSEVFRIFEGGSALFEQIVAVGGFFGHIIYSFFLGLAIILRSFVAQVRFDALAAIALTIFIAAPLLYASRKILRVRRA